MNPFLMSPKDRLADWKTFRQGLAAFPEHEQLEKVAAYFAQASLYKTGIDFDDPASWPTAWEMISDGRWCEQSLAIGMEFTLRLSGWDGDRLRIVYANDRANSRYVGLLIIDHKICLNYYHGTVETVPDDLGIITSIAFKGRVYKKVD